MIDDEVRLEIVRYWRNNPDKLYNIPSHINKVTEDDVTHLISEIGDMNNLLAYEDQLLAKMYKDSELKIRSSEINLLNKSTSASILLAILTTGLLIANILLVVSNYQLLDFQKSFLAPKLQIKQVNAPATFYNQQLVQKSGWTNWLSLCFRNDGRASSGPINVNGISSGSWNNTISVFDVSSANIDDLKPGEGNCTLLGIGHQWTARGDPGNISLVPTGYFRVPIDIKCLFCDKYIQTFDLEVCVKPTDKC